MAYLEAVSVVHRDLACRNCLLQKNEDAIRVKISDFGLGKALDSSYYKTDEPKVPIKWSCPSSIAYGIFSSKVFFLVFLIWYQSDVWSFGIVLWEVFTFGEIPYPGLTNLETIDFVKSGKRMTIPPKAPEVIQNLMLECWKERPEDRPSFKKVLELISEELALQQQSSKPTVPRKLPPLPPKAKTESFNSSFYRV